MTRPQMATLLSAPVLVLAALHLANSAVGFNINDWCPNGGSVPDFGCNLLGYIPDNIPLETTTPISMVGGVGGLPFHESYCNAYGTFLFKHVVKVQVFSDQRTHPGLNFVDQVTLTWSDGSRTIVGGCVREELMPGTSVDCDISWVKVRDSDKHVIDLSGGKRVQAYQMAVDGFHARNVGQAGQLFGYLTMDVTDPSTGLTEQQGYNSCCAGDGYKFTSEKSIGSGVICGVTWRSGTAGLEGAKVDALGFVFLKTYKSK